MKYRARRVAPFSRMYPWVENDAVSAHHAAELEAERLVREDRSLAAVALEIEVEGFGKYVVTCETRRVFRAVRKRGAA